MERLMHKLVAFSMSEFQTMPLEVLGSTLYHLSYAPTLLSLFFETGCYHHFCASWPPILLTKQDYRHMPQHMFEAHVFNSLE
jgi:hypothetical protein